MSKLLINEPPLMVLPSLAVAIGLNEAIALQQLHYWLQTTKHHHDGLPWVYNTAEQWQENFPFWSANTIRRTFGNLRERGIVIVGNYNKMAADRTLWYSIDYAEVEKLDRPFCKNAIPFAHFGQMEVPKLGTAIPETTQKITSIPKIDSDPQAKNTTGDRDGRMLVELIRNAGFMYMDSQPTRAAMLLESDYTDAQLRMALDRTQEAHQKQIKTGKRGITAPLAYMRQVLAGMDGEQLASATTNVVNISTLLENAYE